MQFYGVHASCLGGQRSFEDKAAIIVFGEINPLSIINIPSPNCSTSVSIPRLYSSCYLVQRKCTTLRYTSQ